MDARRDRHRRRRASTAAVLLVLLTGCSANTVAGFSAVKLPSASISMEPTIKAGSTVLVSVDAYAKAPPRVGDIVALHPPQGAIDQNPSCGVPVKDTQLCPEPTQREATGSFIKRVVAGPGDTVAIRGGHAIVNGRRKSEPFIAACGGPACNYPTPITVPAGDWFMLGDNRDMSDDSRFWGPEPQAWIQGKVVVPS